MKHCIDYPNSNSSLTAVTFVGLVTAGGSCLIPTAPGISEFTEAHSVTLIKRRHLFSRHFCLHVNGMVTFLIAQMSVMASVLLVRVNCPPAFEMVSLLILGRFGRFEQPLEPSSPSSGALLQLVVGSAELDNADLDNDGTGTELGNDFVAEEGMMLVGLLVPVLLPLLVLGSPLNICTSRQVVYKKTHGFMVNR